MQNEIKNLIYEKDELKKLDDNWIKNFEKNDKLYQDFYKDDIYYTNLHFIYINKESEIEKIINETFLMSVPNYITREEVISILKRKSIDNNTRYTILSILKYNVTLDAEDIRSFIINYDENKYNNDFLVPIKNIDAIKFEKTINLFHDINDLIIIFYEKTKNSLMNQNLTNNNNNNKNLNTNNNTKRIMLHHNTNKKTIRKQYKD